MKTWWEKKGYDSGWISRKGLSMRRRKQGLLITTQECSTNNNLLFKSDAAYLHLKKEEGIYGTRGSRRGDLEGEKAPNDFKTA